MNANSVKWGGTVSAQGRPARAAKAARAALRTEAGPLVAASFKNASDFSPRTRANRAHHSSPQEDRLGSVRASCSKVAAWLAKVALSALVNAPRST